MTNYQSSDPVHGWLMDVPGYREDYRNQREIMLHEDSKQFISSQKQRPSSLASISSEDSVSLEDLINANFTTDMDDETDLSALASLDLDDSNEDFWKIDNIFNHYIPTQLTNAKESRLLIDNSNRSKYGSGDEFDSKNTSAEDLHEASLYKNPTEHIFLDAFDLKNPADYNISMHPSSPSAKRSDRSGSFSSENSSHSQSTVTTANRHLQRQNIYPSASTSTSSMSSHSSFLSRPSITKSDSNKTNSRIACSKKTSLISSISENTAAPESKSPAIGTTRLPPTRSGLTRRATHIPAPSSKVNYQPSSPTKIAPTPQRTKSTASIIAHKSSNSALNRSASRIGQPSSSRASHIPSPPTKRSTTSLGISSIFASHIQTSSPQQQHHQQPRKDYSRPKTSMGTLKPPSSTTSRSGIRAPAMTGSPISSRSTSLRMPNSRSLYKQ